MVKETSTVHLSAKERRRRRLKKDGGPKKTTKKRTSRLLDLAAAAAAAAGARAGAGVGTTIKKKNKRTKRAPKPQQEPAVQAWTPAPSGASKKPPRPLQAASSGGLPQYPYPVDYCDHFETPLQAYQDIEPLLAGLAGLLHPTGASKALLTCYDPYYCQGRVVRLLASLGFDESRVLNRMSDFYKDLEQGTVPEHDVLVTNPPFSGDHKERILAHCIASGKPWCLLMPNYVANKSYYTETVAPLAARGNAPFYIVPAAKYEFDHPEGTGHATSPFFSIWFCHLPDPAARCTLLPLLLQQQQMRRSWRLVTSAEGLREQGAAPAWKRLSNKRRKKLKKMQGQQQQGQRGHGH